MHSDSAQVLVGHERGRATHLSSARYAMCSAARGGLRHLRQGKISEQSSPLSTKIPVALVSWRGDRHSTGFSTSDRNQLKLEAELRPHSYHVLSRYFSKDKVALS